MVKLYGFTRDYSFPYFCFGKKCYLFKIKYSKYKHKFCKYYGKMNANSMLFNMIHNSNPMCFYGIIKADRQTIYDILDN